MNTRVLILLLTALAVISIAGGAFARIPPYPDPKKAVIPGCQTMTATTGGVHRIGWSLLYIFCLCPYLHNT